MPDKIFPRGRGALLFLVLLAHVLFVPAASWLGVLCAGGLNALLCLLWLAAAKKIQAPDAWALIRRAPVWLRRLSCLALLLLSAWYALRTAQRGAIFLNQTALPEWSAWAGTIALLILCWRIARHGAPALCLWAVPMAWLAGGIAVLSLVLSLSDWQFTPALLSGAFSPSSVLRQLLAVLPATFFLLLFTGYDADLPSGRPVLTGALCAAILAGLTVLRAGAVLGPACARMTAYPVYAAAGVFAAGTLARSEVIFGVAFAICILAKTALALSVIRQSWLALRGGQPSKQREVQT